MIAIAKPPSSTTHKTQPCDVGNSFRGSKGQLKMQSDAKVSTDPIMAVLDKIFKDHTGKYFTSGKATRKAGKESTRTKHMSAEHIKAAKIGLLKIQRAVPSAIRRDIVMSSFSKCGMYPVDANVIFDQFKKADITPEEQLHFVEKLPAYPYKRWAYWWWFW